MKKPAKKAMPKGKKPMPMDDDEGGIAPAFKKGGMVKKKGKK